MREAIRKLNTDYLIVTAVGSAVGKMAVRIFEQGKDVNGGTRSYNTTVPVFIPNNEAPKGQSDTTTRDGVQGKEYSSYSAFRSDMGRESRLMNFRLNNDLQSDLLNATVTRSQDKVGAPKVKVVDNLTAKISINRSENREKADKLEKRFGTKIFELSKSEIKVFRDAAQFEFNKLMSV